MKTQAGWVAHACNLSTEEAEAGGLLHSELEASMGYKVKPRLITHKHIYTQGYTNLSSHQLLAHNYWWKSRPFKAFLNK